MFCHPDTGKPYDPSKMRARFKKTCVKAGVRVVRFHDLRHTYGTHQAAGGAPLRAIQEWMGHRNSQTTEIYAEFLSDGHGREWAERAFGGGHQSGINLSTTETNSDQPKPLENAD